MFWDSSLTATASTTLPGRDGYAHHAQVLGTTAPPRWVARHALRSAPGLH